MMLAIAPAPIVAEGAGPELADAWAGKIAQQWIDAIRVESVDCRELLADFLQANKVPGNETGQRRWAARLRRSFGDRVLGLILQTGNRGRFSCALDILGVGGPVGSQSKPEQFTWLAGLRISFSRGGPNKLVEKDIDVVASLSKHCMTRLVQRAGCRSASDLHSAIMAAWSNISAIEILTRTIRADKSNSSWLLPVTIPTAAEPIVFAMCGPSESDPEGSFFAKSAFPLAFFNTAERRTLMRLHEFLAETKIEDVLGASREKAERLLDCCKSEERR